MRADFTKSKLITQKIGTLRVLSDQTRKEHERIINWKDQHYFGNGKQGSSLAMVLPTRACKYARAKHGGCSFCTLPTDNPYNPTEEMIKRIPSHAIEIFQRKQKEDPELRAVKFYTSGSFLDPWELPTETKQELLRLFVPIVDEIVIETRCEYVIKKHIKSTLDVVDPQKLIVAIGQETTNDEINERANNKGHSFKQFRRAVNLLQSYDIKVKGYVLLKPIFVSEIQAYKDALLTAKNMYDLGVTGISINPCYIGKGTLMEELFQSGSYRPPWLWTVLEVTKKIKRMVGEDVIVITDPVAAGKERGPQNCGKCDSLFRENLKKFSGTQNMNHISKIHCDCFEVYERYLQVEHLKSGYGVLNLKSH